MKYAERIRMSDSDLACDICLSPTLPERQTGARMRRTPSPEASIQAVRLRYQQKSRTRQDYTRPVRRAQRATRDSLALSVCPSGPNGLNLFHVEMNTRRQRLSGRRVRQRVYCTAGPQHMFWYRKLFAFQLRLVFPLISAQSFNNKLRQGINQLCATQVAWPRWRTVPVSNRFVISKGSAETSWRKNGWRFTEAGYFAVCVNETLMPNIGGFRHLPASRNLDNGHLDVNLGQQNSAKIFEKCERPARPIHVVLS